MIRAVTRIVQTALVAALLGTILTGALSARPPAAMAYTARVTMFDNDAKLIPGDAPGTAQWGFAPAHLVVTQGDTIILDNPASNNLFHTVTSIVWQGPLYDRALLSGTVFNSSTSEEERLNPGSVWALDTSELQPGHYDFYCQPHPWMIGSFFVMARPR